MTSIMLFAALVAGQPAKASVALEGVYRVKYVAPPGSPSTATGEFAAMQRSTVLTLQSAGRWRLVSNKGNFAGTWYTKGDTLTLVSSADSPSARVGIRSRDYTIAADRKSFATVHRKGGSYYVFTRQPKAR
jgi:hypothetical protein